MTFAPQKITTQFWQLAILGLALSLAPQALALNFTTPWAQCANVTVAWTAGGVAPYELLLVPVGHLTPETRTIINYQNITPSTSSSPSGALNNTNLVYEFSFPLTFPAGSEFVAVLSDSKYGPGSGGTSQILVVLDSQDTSCLNTEQVKPAFYFYLDTPTPSQCTPWQISWPQTIDEVTSNNTSPSSGSTALFDGMSLWAIVPGVTTFAVPLPSPPTALSSSSDPVLDYTSWTVDLAHNTELMLVAGYTPQKGIINARGKGGSTDVMIVGNGTDGSACLSTDPPKTTLFPTAAGTSTSTGAGASGTSSSGGGSPNGTNGSGAATRRRTLPFSSLSLSSSLSPIIGIFMTGSLGVLLLLSSF
ncbi:hypothetical protein DL93DRAFT_2085567 [Clavulina sp. PMI_390]|nr:hypothetical protein DL93DRAFT_2085567 [Clavulina sp. PMI_390]